MRREPSLILLLCAVLFGLIAPLGPAFADKRVALVIGNSQYKNTPPLANPANDATDVAQALTAIGFEVTLKVDAGKRDMDQAVAQFARDAGGADAAMFYYAGHGMQFEGHNYVMPVDAELRDEISLRYEMIAIDDVKAALERSSGVKIMVLDSCRNNPLATKLVRSISVTTRDIPNIMGFARPEKTRGMIIVYATQADDVANDGSGRNSPFSTAFLKEIKEPGLEVGTMFRRVGSDVYQATNGQQSPELSISLVPEYYLNQAETDQTVWARIRDGADADTLREFLDRYPKSFYAPDARARLELLDREVGDVRGKDANAANAARLRADQLERERVAQEAEAREQALATRLAAAEAERQKLASELAPRQTAAQTADAGAAKANNRFVKENADQALKSEADRAQALKAEIASLEQQAADAKADAENAANARKSNAPAETKPVLASLTPEQVALVVPIQLEMRRLGCYDAGGDWQSGEMQRSISKYARYANLAAPPEAPSPALLETLKGQRERVCPSECSPRENEVQGRCVAKTCPADSYLARNGACVRRPPVEPRVAAVRAAPRPAAPAAPRNAAPAAARGHCFNFNGNQYCE
jgi:uncharacterized caspase-like protein